MKCYHCGNCSAVCPFSKDPYVFPRKPMRYLQMGLEEKLKGSLEPWLCYYCGECSDAVPARRRAGRDDDEPAALAHRAVRLDRHLPALLPLVAAGNSARSSLVAILTAIALHAVRAVAGQTSPIYDGPNAFLPSSSIHIFDWMLAAVLLGVPAQQLRRACGGSRWAATRRSRRCPGQLPQQPLAAARRTSSRRRATASASARALADPPRADAELRDHAGADHVLPAEMASGPEHRLERPRASAISPPRPRRHRRSCSCATALKKTATQYRHSHESDWIFLVLLLFVALDRDPAAHPAPQRSRRGGQRRPTSCTSGRRPDARARGALQQVVAPRLPARWPCTSRSVRATALARRARATKPAQRGAEPAAPLRAA